MCRLIIVSLFSFLSIAMWAQDTDYKLDILGVGFEQLTIAQSNDYEGEVVCTLVRKKASLKAGKAVLYVHGFGDYFFQKEMADEYVAHGYDFYAVDLRKYGRSYLSHQKFNNVRSIAEYYADIDAALSQIKAEGHQFVLLSGHSTGGLTVSVYAHDHPNSDLFSAIFLNSPFYDFNVNWFNRKVGVSVLSVVGKKNPDKIVKGGFSTLYGKSLHQDEKGEWAYDFEYKPLHAPEVNCGFIRAIHNAQIKTHHVLDIDVPMLVMHSNRSLHLKEWSDEMFTGDAVLNVKHIHKTAAKIKGNIIIQSIEGGMHDLVLSPLNVRKKVYSNLFEWLDNLAF